jgi:nucleoid DNA-binding protein
MLTKADLIDALTQELESRDVEDAEEIADSVVEVLDEQGAFDRDEEANE